MSTAGRCPCVNPERRSHQTRDKENVPSNSQSKSHSIMLDKNTRPKVLVPEDSARTLQNTSARRYHCGCTSKSRVPLTDLKGQNSKNDRIVTIKTRCSEPRVPTKTFVKTVATSNNSIGVKADSATTSILQTSSFSLTTSSVESFSNGASSSNFKAPGGTGCSPTPKAIARSLSSNSSKTVKTNQYIRGPNASSTLIANTTWNQSPILNIAATNTTTKSSRNKTANSTSSSTLTANQSDSSTLLAGSWNKSLNSAASSTRSSRNKTANTIASSTLVANGSSSSASSLLVGGSWNKSANSTGSSTATITRSSRHKLANTASTTLIANASTSSASSTLVGGSWSKAANSTRSLTLINGSSGTHLISIASSTLMSNKSSSQRCYEEKGDVVINNSNYTNSSAFWQTLKCVKIITGPYKIARQVPVHAGSTEKEVSIPERIIHDGIPSLKKKTLKKHLNVSSNIFGIVNLDSHTNKIHPRLLYQLDMIHDIMQNIITTQKANVLRFEFLEENDQLAEHRCAVVNWLVKLHQYLAPDTNVFFVAVRLFDKLLEPNNIPQHKYQLVALLTYWISLKYNNSVKYSTAPNLLKLCNNRYDLNVFLRLEREILTLLNFDLAIDDPMIFVYYFLYIMKTANSTMISFCANYFLEVLALEHNCNCYSLSLQAASAVFLALKVLGYNDSYWKKMKQFNGYHAQEEMYDIHQIILRLVALMDNENFPYREPYKKYSTAKYDKVSLRVAHIMENI